MEDPQKCLQANDGSCVWVPSIVAGIARFLSANEIACILRLVDKATSQQYATCKTVRLSLPSPAHNFKESWGRPESFRRYTRKQRLKLLCLTAASGSIANLEVALDNAGLCLQGRVGSELVKAAAEAGQLDVFKMLLERGCPWSSVMAAAARGGHRHVCEWILASGCPFHCSIYPTAVNAAARGGHESLMYWLMTRQVVHPTDVLSLLRAAAAGLNLAPFQRLHQQLLTGQQQQQPVVALDQVQQARILAAAAASSTPDWQAKVEWLEGQGYPKTHLACDSAAGCSPDEEAVSRLQWLHIRGYTPDVDAVVEAASHGNLAALRFLVEQAGVQPGLVVSGDAAKNGHLDVLQYIHTRGLHLEHQSDLVQSAAEEGHLPVVAWAVEALGVTPDSAHDNLLNWAAGSGSVELMTWLHERGWTWGQYTMSNAAESGCEEAVEWLVEQGCPLPLGSFTFIDPIIKGDLAMIRCLHRRACPWSPNQLAMCINLAGLKAPVLQCLVDLGCSVD